MAKRKPTKAPPVPEGWEVARRVTRTDVMPTRTHGVVSNRTARRKARQEGRARGWED
jgi:hypothetical protein